MAIYRCEFKIYGRSRGQSAVAASAYVTGTRQRRAGGTVKGGISAVAAAAYRSSEKLEATATGEMHDYTRKAHVSWSGILAPEEAPEWVYDRGQLWNAVETVEKRKDAQLFRECLLTLPRELDVDQQRALVQAYVRDQFVKEGMVADIGIHVPTASDGGEQPHAHVMLTLRAIGPDGFGAKRRDWNEVQWGNGTARKGGFLEQRRAAWADYCNAALAEAESEARVDHRSLAAQREEALDHGDLVRAAELSREPQPKLGAGKWITARLGHLSDSWKRWVGVDHRNRVREQAHGEALEESGGGRVARLIERLRFYGHQLGMPVDGLASDHQQQQAERA